MKQKIQIAIPEPCQENWQNMTLVEKGRFCSSCQKTVLDLTQLSDNEIIKLVSKNDNLCIRIKETQLNRDLIPIIKTSNYFSYLMTSVLAFLGLGTESVIAQDKPKVEQNIIRKSTNLDVEFVVRGIVKDTLGKGIKTYLHVKGQKPVLTNDNGEFEICVKKNQLINIENDDFEYFECKISDTSFLEIVLENYVRKTSNGFVGGAVVIIESEVIHKKRTFFGRFFYKIGNWFR